MDDFTVGRDLEVDDVLARQYYMFDSTTPLEISGDFELLNTVSGLPWVCLTPMCRVLTGSLMTANAYGKYELRVSLDDAFCKTLTDLQRELLYEMWDRKQSSGEEEEVSWGMYYRDATKCLVGSTLKTSCRATLPYGDKRFISLYDRFGTEHTGTMDVDKGSMVQVHIQMRGYEMDNGMYGVCCQLHHCGVLLHTRTEPMIREHATPFHTYVEDKRLMDVTGHPLRVSQTPQLDLEEHHGNIQYGEKDGAYQLLVC